MVISNKYIVVDKPIIKEVEANEFEVVVVQDESTYKGIIKILPECPIFFGNKQAVVGDTVIFAKYSPNTHDIEDTKFVAVDDLLAII